MCCCLLQLLWNYKLNLTTDPKFESVATEVCKSTIAEVGLHFSCKNKTNERRRTFSMCSNMPADKGVQRRGAGEGLPGVLSGGSPWQHQRVPVQPVHHQDDQHHLQRLQADLWLHGQM